MWLTRYIHFNSLTDNFSCSFSSWLSTRLPTHTYCLCLNNKRISNSLFAVIYRIPLEGVSHRFTFDGFSNRFPFRVVCIRLPLVYLFLIIDSRIPCDDVSNENHLGCFTNRIFLLSSVFISDPRIYFCVVAVIELFLVCFFFIIHNSRIRLGDASNRLPLLLGID